MTLLACILSVLLASPLGSGSQPVRSTHSIKNVSADTVRLVFDLTIQDGWHVYSTGLSGSGPISAEVEFDNIQGVQPISGLQFKGNEISQFDPVFSMDVRFFKSKVTFWQDMLITDPAYVMEGSLTYGACNDESCLQIGRAHV